ncbi:MAG: hypothetical protein HW421_3788 [Ignavibacteria bacterium]|nr:hypothetical protein [Ignavibacteria bacterium]
MKKLVPNINITAVFTGLIFLITISLSGQSKYNLLCNSKLLSASVDTALQQIGIREKSGNNDGEVKKYLDCLGMREGLPYCAAGQYWCFMTAADGLGLNRKLIPIKRTAVANEMFSHASNTGRRMAYRASVHDLIVWRNKGSFSGHIERVYQVQKAGWVETIGFNTGGRTNTSQRDGSGVFKKRRNIYHPIGRMAVRGLIGFDSN